MRDEGVTGYFLEQRPYQKYYYYLLLNNLEQLANAAINSSGLCWDF